MGEDIAVTGAQGAERGAEAEHDADYQGAGETRVQCQQVRPCHPRDDGVALCTMRLA